MTAYTRKNAILDTVLMAYGVGMFGLISYTAVLSVKYKADLNPSTERALRDASFTGPMADAGYRLEKQRDRWGFEWIVARCARSDGKGPLACDPAPRPTGAAGEAMKVIR